MRIFVCVMFVLSTGSAHAAGGQSAREMFRQLDQNGDRIVQFNEIQAARAEFFRHADTNANGILEVTEIQAVTGRIGGAGGMEFAALSETEAPIARMDLTGDGRISRDEFVTFLPERVLRADSNGDGELSVAELRTIRQ